MIPYIQQVCLNEYRKQNNIEQPMLSEHTVGGLSYLFFRGVFFEMCSARRAGKQKKKQKGTLEIESPKMFGSY